MSSSPRPERGDQTQQPARPTNARAVLESPARAPRRPPPFRPRRGLGRGRRLTSFTVLALLLASGFLVAPTVPGTAAHAEPAPVEVAPTRGVWPLSPRPEVIRGFDPPDAPWGAGHRGVDLAASVGQEVRTAADGVVSFAGQLAGRGVVAVVHGAVRTTYEPVTPVVAVGDRVTAGIVIGHVQGGSTHCLPVMPCLHWGLLRGREYLNPLSLLRRGPSRLLPVWGVPPAYDRAGVEGPARSGAQPFAAEDFGPSSPPAPPALTGAPVAEGDPVRTFPPSYRSGGGAPENSGGPPGPAILVASSTAQRGQRRDSSPKQHRGITAVLEPRVTGGLSALGLMGALCLVRRRSPVRVAARRLRTARRTALPERAADWSGSGWPTTEALRRAGPGRAGPGMSAPHLREAHTRSRAAGPSSRSRALPGIAKLARRTRRASEAGEDGPGAACCAPPPWCRAPAECWWPLVHRSLMNSRSPLEPRWSPEWPPTPPGLSGFPWVDAPEDAPGELVDLSQERQRRRPEPPAGPA
jgi:hypothetical protein